MDAKGKKARGAKSKEEALDQRGTWRRAGVVASAPTPFFTRIQGPEYMVGQACGSRYAL